MATATVKKDRTIGLGGPRKKKRKTRKSSVSAETKLNQASIRVAIGRLIRSRREALGLTQATMGAAAKIPHPAMSAFETGKRNITPRMTTRLARGLKMQTEDLQREFDQIRTGSGVPIAVKLGTKPARKPPGGDLETGTGRTQVKPGTIELKFPGAHGVDIKVVVGDNGGSPTNAALVEAAQNVVSDLGSRLLPG